MLKQRLLLFQPLLVLLREPDEPRMEPAWLRTVTLHVCTAPGTLAPCGEYLVECTHVCTHVCISKQKKAINCTSPGTESKNTAVLFTSTFSKTLSFFFIFQGRNASPEKYQRDCKIMMIIRPITFIENNGGRLGHLTDTDLDLTAHRN